MEVSGSPRETPRQIRLRPIQWGLHHKRQLRHIMFILLLRYFPLSTLVLRVVCLPRQRARSPPTAALFPPQACSAAPQGRPQIVAPFSGQIKTPCQRVPDPRARSAVCPTLSCLDLSGLTYSDPQQRTEPPIITLPRGLAYSGPRQRTEQPVVPPPRGLAYLEERVANKLPVPGDLGLETQGHQPQGSVYMTLSAPSFAMNNSLLIT